MDLQLFSGYATLGTTGIIGGKVLFGFDLDHTIIKPISGKFCKTAIDWEFLPGMDKLIQEISRFAPVVIFTNQGGVAAKKTTLPEVIARIGAVVAALKIQTMVFIGLSEQYYKPSPLLYQSLIYGYAPEIERGFYIGDASDMDTDFADTDYRFALNTGLAYIPVGKFISIANSAGGYPEILIPRLYEARSRHELAEVPIGNWLSADAIVPKPTENQRIMVVLVGPPGCGKSTYAKTLGWTVLSRDALGSATAAQYLKAVKAKIAEVPKDKPLSLILDATHPDIKSREAYIVLARAQGMKICAVHFEVPIEIAKYMNKIRCIMGGNYVPEIAYGTYLKRAVKPSAEEGFDEVVTITSLRLNDIPVEYLNLHL